MLNYNIILTIQFIQFSYTWKILKQLTVIVIFHRNYFIYKNIIRLHCNIDFALRLGVDRKFGRQRTNRGVFCPRIR